MSGNQETLFAILDILEAVLTFTSHANSTGITAVYSNASCVFHLQTFVAMELIGDQDLLDDASLAKTALEFEWLRTAAALQ